MLDIKEVGIMYFTADWCGPCKVFGPRLSQFVEKHDLDLRKVDVDKMPHEAQYYGVMSLPTTIWFRKGEAVLTKVGPLTEDQLEQTFRNAR